MKALVIDVKTWPDDANANLELLIRDVDQLKSKSVGYEKTMWERIGTELEKVDVESLEFDHLIYSEVLISNQNLSQRCLGRFVIFLRNLLRNTS